MVGGGGGGGVRLPWQRHQHSLDQINPYARVVEWFSDTSWVFASDDAFLQFSFFTCLSKAFFTEFMSGKLIQFPLNQEFIVLSRLRCDNISYAKQAFLCWSFTCRIHSELHLLLAGESRVARELVSFIPWRASFIIFLVDNEADCSVLKLTS